MKKKINIPKKGAGRKWAARLKELGQQAPPQELIDIVNHPSALKEDKIIANEINLNDLERK